MDCALFSGNGADICCVTDRKGALSCSPSCYLFGSVLDKERRVTTSRTRCPATVTATVSER